MLFSLGNVITIAVVLLILIAFRIAESRNRPNIEKLKRQSDMLTEHFLSIAKERKAEVEAISAEITGSLKNSSEILKRTRAVEESLASRAGDLDAIGRKFAEYDATLRELDAMSGRVDQNLKHVRGESAFLDAAGKRLGEAAAQLDRLEARVGAVAAEFAAQNRTALEEAREAVVASAASRAGDLGDAVTQTESRVKDLTTYVARLEAKTAQGERDREAGAAKALDAFTQGLSERLAAASQRAETLEDEVFARLRETLERDEAAIQKAMTDLSHAVSDHEADADYRLRRVEESGADIEALAAALKETAARTAAASRDDMKAYAAELNAAWKENVTAAEGERQQLAAGLAELAAELGELKKKAYQDVGGKLAAYEDEFFADLRTRADTMQERLAAWQAEVEARIASVGAGAAAAREELERRHQEELRAGLEELRRAAAEDADRIEEQIAGLETNARERTAAAEEGLAAMRGTLAAELERARRDAAALAEKEMAGVRDAADVAARKLARGIEQATSDGEAAIASLREEFASQKEELVVASQEERAALRAELAEFRTRLAEQVEEAEAERQKLAARIDEGHRALAASLSDTDRRVKAFQSQTRLFERADALRASLEGDIEGMKKELARLSGEKAEVGELEVQLGRTRKMADEVSGKLARFLAERRRIDDMEGDFKKVVALSRDVDLKLEGLAQANDALQQVQAKVRQFEELGRTVEGGFERLEKKRDVLAATAEGVDRSFQRLETFEKTLAAAGRDLEALALRAQSLKGDLETMAGSKQAADSAMEIAGKLDALTGDLERRLEQAQASREWLARTETRFEEITRQAAEQVRLLESIVKSETKRDKTERGAPPLDKRDTVIKLSHQGWSVPEISRVTQLSRGEVELILELAPKA
jgi:chromosome segregation ATPase